ncbi:hypothetical protein HW532_20000 [Kaustia mangrovi]|uniref:BPL/LPL catalytic domain-containing protein n=1 Tax=Kaustia mangrovi TaxID=2593653 RepID=A0A7S8C7K7_9HYPH|nr:biotin/lipoate--protein ligase family protein [Kaustia mangrovi]QPC44781.1 hypothetical protein HW532_20000 [Kaustia mangrovi]
MDQRDPTFPPLMSGRVAVDPPDPFACAKDAAARGEASAGEVFWLPDRDRVRLAVVLEPDVPAERAVQMQFAMMVAAGDALGAAGPPEMAVHYRWPGVIAVNGAVAGEVRLALPDDAGTGDVPRWLVVALDLALARPEGAPEPGEEAGRTTLRDEGLGDIGPSALIESLCRHFLVWIHLWTDDGFRPVHDAWMARLEGGGGDTEAAADGARGRAMGLEEDGSLLLRTEEGMRACAFMDHVERVAGEGAS